MESLSCCAAHESITAAQIPYILAGVKFLLLQLIDACNMILQLSPQSTQTHFSIVITNSFNTMFQYCCPPPIQGSAPKCCSTAMFAPAKVTGAAAADAQTCLVDTLMMVLHTGIGTSIGLRVESKIRGRLPVAALAARRFISSYAGGFVVAQAARAVLIWQGCQAESGAHFVDVSRPRPLVTAATACGGPHPLQTCTW